MARRYIVRSCRMRSRPAVQLIFEALTAGITYAAGLCWTSVCLLAILRPRGLSAPYWRDIAGLRTDTCGIAAFFAVAICFTMSEYLRLRPKDSAATPNRVSVNGAIKALALAASRTIMTLSSGLVIYISLNAVTHPATLDMQATHLAAWPTEGTLRVTALLLSALSVTILRYMAPKVTATRDSSLTTASPSVRAITNDTDRHEPGATATKLSII